MGGKTNINLDNLLVIYYHFSSFIHEIFKLKLIFFSTMVGKQSFAVLDNEKKVFQRLRTEVSSF